MQFLFLNFNYGKKNNTYISSHTTLEPSTYHCMYHQWYVYHHLKSTVLRVSITKTKWLNCLGKLLFVVRIMQNKHTVGKLQYLNVDTGGTYIYHCDLMG